MAHWETRPDPRLTAWVTSLRFSSDDDEASAQRLHRVVPDGGVDLIFSVPTQGDDVQSDVFGIKSKARLVGGDGPRENAAIHFRPGAASRFLGVAAHELVDRRVDISLLWRDGGSELAERVANAPDAGARGRLLEGALLERLETVLANDSLRRRLADVAVRKIRSAVGRLPIRDLAAELEIGERRLERLFRDEVGLAPKHFSRIVRLEAALTLLRAGRSQVEVALDCGYSDQPHLLRDFCAFTGQSPTAFFGAHRASE